MFPRPWRAEFCGDCYRIFDANDRQLFVICGDDFGGDEDEGKPTVLEYGEDADHDALTAELEQMFPGEGKT